MSVSREFREYLALIKRVPLIPIKSARQLQTAIDLMKEMTVPSRLKTLSEYERGYLDVLSDLISKYERENLTRIVDPMTPAEALGYLMEQSEISQSELARQTGTQQAHLSEFLAGKRSLSKRSISNIAHHFNVSHQLLLPRV